MFSYHLPMIFLFSLFLAMFSYHQPVSFAVFAVPGSVFLSSTYDFWCFRCSWQCFLILNLWNLLFSLFLAVFSYRQPMIFAVFAVPGNVFLSSTYVFCCFRCSWQCFLTLNLWNLLFSLSLAMFSYHQHMIFVVFAVPGNVFLLSSYEMCCVFIITWYSMMLSSVAVYVKHMWN